VSANLFSLLRARVEGRGERICLRVPDGPVLTYDDLDRRSAELAGVLVAAGAQAGDRVVVQVDKSPDAVALYLACLRAGLVHVPLNTAYTPLEVSSFLVDAAPRVLVCRPGSEGSLAGAASGVGAALHTLGASGDGTLAERARAVAPFDAVVERDPDDPAAMLYTSGTTGRSKGAVSTHRNLASNALALHEVWGFGPDDVLLHALPVFHVHGLFVALHCAFLDGCEVIFLPRFDAAAVLRHLTEATVLMGVPTFYSRLLDIEGFGRDDCRTIRLFTCGSAPLTETVFNRFTERTGHVICERYGMTEAGIITSNPLRGERIAGTVGYALPGVELRVVGDDGTPLPPGSAGIVEARGPGVFAGYWNEPGKTAEALGPDGFLHTGDVGTLAADGRLTLAGRASDLIISGGYNIYPKEIELVLDEVPGVVESAVVGLPDADLGEIVAAFVVPAPGSGVDESHLAAAVDGRLARFKHPRRYLIVDDLPRNAMGKVQKAELRRAGGGTGTD
jgi:malonyl-CoA/methylmalonyl-CoA synthetase